MEDLKYFVPQIEDIRVGYECEQLIDYITHNEWKKEIFGKGCWLPEGDVGGIMHWYHTCIINKRLRTAYLTKEQIEAEGWKPVKVKTPWLKVDGFEKIIEEGFNTGVKYTLYYINKKLHISAFSYGSWAQSLEDLYSGECPSINEFRMITKLLNIK